MLPSRAITDFALPFWQDLVIHTSGPAKSRVFYGVIDPDSNPSTPNRRLIIQFSNLIPWELIDEAHWYGLPAPSNGITFQVVFYEDRPEKITFQYKDVDCGDSRFNFGAGATVGVQFYPLATQYSCKEARLRNGLALDFILVDRSKVDIQIEGVDDGAFYNFDVNPLIKIEGYDFENYQVFVNGANISADEQGDGYLIFKPGILSTEGTYNIYAFARNKAGNETSASVTFAIDKTPAQITISGIEDKAYYNTSRSPEVKIAGSDVEDYFVKLNDTTITLTTQTAEELIFEIGEVSVEGIHTIYAYAKDKAGNESTESVTFTIDKTAPSISIEGVEDKAL